MQFRTEYKATPRRPIEARREIVMLGSCFADNIGERLRRCMAPVSVNPCGTLFNPSSIASALGIALGDIVPLPAVCDDGRWFSWHFSTLFSATARDDLEVKTAAASAELQSALAKAGTLIVTFGTAIVYELAARPRCIVANCHKRPASEFTRRMLTVGEIADLWLTIAERLLSINPELRIILTVSPVRHLKEGMHQNTLSKATLHLACEELCRRLPAFEYFPAFEIVNDDLRDYRFCAADLQHPSEMAVEYVWQKFCETYISAADMQWLTEGARLTARREHRHLNPDTAAAHAFNEQTQSMLQQFTQRHPWAKIQ